MINDASPKKSTRPQRWSLPPLLAPPLPASSAPPLRCYARRARPRDSKSRRANQRVVRPSQGIAREAGANRCRAEFSLWECGSSSPATFPAPFGCQHAKNACLSTNATHGDRNYAPLAAAPKRRTLTRLPQAVAEQPEIGRLEVNLIYDSIFQIAYRPYDISPHQPQSQHLIERPSGHNVGVLELLHRRNSEKNTDATL